MSSDPSTRPEPSPSPGAPTSGGDEGGGESRAAIVAGGILSSRLLGLVRERAVAYFFGVGPHADVFQAVFKGPNLLQNLLGEGSISAAFIPVYSRLLEEGREREAGRFAGAVLGLLLALAAAVSLLGILLAGPIVAVLTPGFLDDAQRVAAGELAVDRYALAVTAVKLIFPMTGFLVLSAWALGVLNSHRRFFLPYFAPVVWNLAILAGLFAGAGALSGALSGNGLSRGAESLDRILLAGCAGALVGGLLQFAVQAPGAFRRLSGFRLSLSTRVTGVRRALSAFGPVVAGRGVYQISGYLDVLLASLLAAGALGAVRYAQILYLLPVSLFGLSVAASELPELSRLRPEAAAPFFARVRRSLAQILFLVVPTAAGYLVFGHLLVLALFGTGRFGRADGLLVYAVLCGYTAGLPATTVSRLLQNSFYALSDTRTPAKIAGLRVAVSAAVAVPAMLWLDRIPVTAALPAEGGGRTLFFGAVGLAVGSALGAWVELLALRAALRRRRTGLELPWGRAARMVALALAAMVPAYLLGRGLPPGWHPALRASAVVAVFAGGYLGVAAAFGSSELSAWLGRLSRRSTSAS